MNGDEHREMLLGKHTPLVDAYAPQLLFPIARARGRQGLGITGPLPFDGFDVWHAYELSWLDHTCKPVARVGRLCVPASSPNMVESKSLKLYFNSLNNTCFGSEAELVRTVRVDIAAVAGAPVELELLDVCDPRLAGSVPPGDCLDDLEFAPVAGEPRADLLETGEQYAEQTFYSHLLRSLCPVTGQPDWATVWLSYGGPRLCAPSLLSYIVAYRRHQEFHEQCIERMFCDIQARCRPRFLHVQGCYTRRGGLDISPFRSTDPQAAPLPRLNRQ